MGQWGLHIYRHSQPMGSSKYAHEHATKQSTKNALLQLQQIFLRIAMETFLWDIFAMEFVTQKLLQ